MLTIDHVSIPSRDPRVSAQFLADILGVSVEHDGPNDEFPCLRLDAGVQVLFAESTTFTPHHVAFRCDELVFAKALAQIIERGLAFGNDPDDLTNGAHSDPLGGKGRVYFQDPDGHLFEICA